MHELLTAAQATDRTTAMRMIIPALKAMTLDELIATTTTADEALRTGAYDYSTSADVRDNGVGILNARGYDYFANRRG